MLRKGLEAKTTGIAAASHATLVFDLGSHQTSQKADIEAAHLEQLVQNALPGAGDRIGSHKVRGWDERRPIA